MTVFAECKNCNGSELRGCCAKAGLRLSNFVSEHVRQQLRRHPPTCAIPDNVQIVVTYNTDRQPLLSFYTYPSIPIFFLIPFLSMASDLFQEPPPMLTGCHAVCGVRGQMMRMAQARVVPPCPASPPMRTLDQDHSIACWKDPNRAQKHTVYR
jgi:hypothetical protein